MRIAVLSGGVGGAKFAQGVEQVADQPATLIVNTADDFWFSGLRVCPDLDSVMYALAGVNDTAQGWGRSDESTRVQEELNAYGAGWPWFTLGDLDIGTHIARTGWLAEGVRLSVITQRLCDRFQLTSTLLPMTDDVVETIVHTRDPEHQTLHLEEWWVRYRAQLDATGFEFSGAGQARAHPEALEAITNADVVFVAPSNPIVSIGPVLALPELREALRETAAAVIGVSPIIADAPVRGMAAQCLAAVGVSCTALGVAGHYGSRAAGGVLDAWLIAEEDRDQLSAVEALGLKAAAAPLWMRSPEHSAEIVRAALALTK